MEDFSILLLFVYFANLDQLIQQVFAVGVSEFIAINNEDKFESIPEFECGDILEPNEGVVACKAKMAHKEKQLQFHLTLS